MNKKIIKEILYWGQILLLPIYWISFITPRSKTVWVFGSTFGNRFADNPKYFYLYMNQHHRNDFKCIWITRNKDIVKLLRENNLPVYYLYSFQGFWYSIRAKVYLYDNYSKDVCFLLSGRATKINMWHGIPLKKIQTDNIFDRVRNPGTILEQFKGFPRRLSDEKKSHYILSTSKFLEPIFSSAFNTKNVIICGYPRNDILLTNIIKNVLTDGENKLLQYLNESKQTNKLVLYMPTFRDSEEEFFNLISVASFDNFLQREKIIFCVKLHHKSKMKEKFLDISSNNIINIDANTDPYPLLILSDALVTDYSSIYFDFLLTKKSIIFFPYDLDIYLKESREMYFSYNHITIGDKVYTQNDLEDALVSCSRNEIEQDNLCRKLFDQNSQCSSEDLFNQILKFL